MGSNLKRQTYLEWNRAYKILIVDDDPIFRQVLNRLLLQRGYQVLEARSTGDAESLLRDGPDLLIVDYRMPNSDGAAWIKKLRDLGVTIPIVFCSASTLSSALHANLRNVLKVDLIVSKPLAEEDFIRQLQSLLPRQKEAHEEHWVNEDEPLISDTIGNLLDLDSQKATSSLVAEDADQTSAYTEELPQLIPQDATGVSDTQTSPKTTAAIRDLATLYLTELPSIARLLRQELTDSREHNVLSLLQTSADQAHMLSGASGTLGFTEIHKIARQLEECLKEAASPSGSDHPLDYSLIGDLLNALDRSIQIAANNDSAQIISKTPSIALDQSIQIATDSDDAQIIAQKPAILEAPDSISVPRFLILSDSAAECLAFSSILAKYQSALTSSLSEGMSVFSILEDYRPSLLFIDADLGKTNSYNICRMIRCNPAWNSLPILFMMSNCSAECRAEIFACGADDFVVKPVNEIELLMRVGMLLNWVGQHEEHPG